MTGPEHYLEAERLIRSREVDEEWGTYTQRPSKADIETAQVHATLALAAATAYPAVRDYCGDEANEPREWTGAIS